MSGSRYYQQLDVSDKVALITGASSGFGEAIAHRFAELGMKLILVARREDRLRALAATLHEAHGCQSFVLVQDVTQTAALETLLDRVPPEYQQVYCLVNNAGLVFGVPAAQDVDMQHVQTMMQTNVVAVIALTKACLKGMLERNDGHIINIGSTAGHEAYPGGGVYNATKFALAAYTTATRHDLVGTNIRVTAISPGAVETEFSLVRFAGDAARAAAVYEGMAKMTAADIADNVTYCLTRPAHVQIADIVVTSVHQSGAKYVARPLLQQPKGA